MPKRMLDGDISKSWSLNKISEGAECTFYRLLTTSSCDDKGRFDGRIELLFHDLHPLRPEVTFEILGLRLKELEDEGCIHWYASGGKPYGHFPNWHKFQRLREDRYKHPDPKGICLGCKVAADGGQNLPLGGPEVEVEGKRREENSDPDTSVSETPGRIKKSLQDFPGEHITIGNALRSVIPKSMPGQPIPDLEDSKFYKWLTQIRLLLTVDNDKNAGGKWTTALVLKVVEWLPTHEGSAGFRWGEQVLSGRALRKHFPKLLNAMEKTNGRQGSSAQWEQMRKDEENQGVDGGTHF